MEPLSQRQNMILCEVVETHIETTQPVGSRVIAEKYAYSFSPATVRNEMGVLEEQGYLTHPHTSSGRVPTDRGYRYYLDHTPFEQVFAPDYFDRVAEELSPVAEEAPADYFLDRVSTLLSAMSQEVGMALLPFSRSSSAEGNERTKIGLQGLTRILEKPEFQDVQKIKVILNAFEEKGTLTRWVLKNASEEQVAVSVGHEHSHEALEDCAIVTARYAVGEDRQGAIAILGPKRMPYRQIIPLVSRMACVVGNIMERWDSDEV